MVNDKVLVKTKESYYTNAEKLGELLMETMLQEVDEFCKMDIQQNWGTHAHQQVISSLYSVTCQSPSYN